MRAALLGLLVGCTFTRGGAVTSDGQLIDASSDGSSIDVIPPDACMTFSTQLDTCAVTAWGGNILLTGSSTYDTATFTIISSGAVVVPPRAVVTGPAGPIDVWFVNSFTLADSASLRVNGDKPFGIVAKDTITIDGVIDLSSDNAAMPPYTGAGASDTTFCGASNGGKGVNDTGGGGGGGGGGYQGAGGVGGLGDKDDTVDTPGGILGIVKTRPNGPRGGCAGGAGGNGQTVAPAGGNGGGAVFFASPTMVSIGSNGVVDVGGSGGLPGAGNGTAGSGGGSGGMILIEAGSVRVMGVLAANGGGGGEGNGTGNPGSKGTRTTARAAGGSNGDFTGGDGGGGGAGTNINGVTPTDLQNGGGGGGGGGVGYIAISGSVNATGGTITPGFQTWP